MLIITEDNFEKEVLESKKYFFLLFGTPACESCVQGSIILADIEKEYPNDIIVGTVNTFKQFSLTNGCQVLLRYYPTLIIYKNGKEIKRVEGNIYRDNIKQLLPKILEKKEIKKPVNNNFSFKIGGKI